MFGADIPARLENIPGNLSLWLEDLDNGETLVQNPDSVHVAASVIKLGVMLAAFCAFETGTLDPGSLYRLKESDKVPSCGVLTYLHAGLEVTYLDLVTLMIILSDNTATNVMIDILGIDAVNAALDEYGLSGIRLRRKMFDDEAAARGLQNTITARDVAAFFRLLYRKELVSPEASKQMLDLLLNQRLNGKIPFFLHEAGIRVAHKTGEDDETSHDAGIIFADRPLVAVFLGNDTDVPQFERAMQDIARKIAFSGRP